MTGLVERVRVAPRRVDAAALSTRIDALARLQRAGTPYLPAELLEAAGSVVARADQRLALSRDHTVVALVGPTGSGKSSLFNAMAGGHLSPVGARRPTTGAVHACVWGPPEAAADLLDWLGVAREFRHRRESPLDGDDQAGLRGLVLLDLPDFDSVEESHRVEVDRLLRLVDLVVWVVDPQKYADQVVHRNYLAEFHRHREVTVVVLNQADTLRAADLTRILADLRRLLDADELAGVPALGTSAVDAPSGLAELRAVLERAVAERQAALRRLAADVDDVVAGLDHLVGPPGSDELVSRTVARRLTDSLAWSSGVTAVVAAVEASYRRRAGAATGWPPVRWAHRLRMDPLRRLGLNPRAEESAINAAPGTVQRSAAGLAVRVVASTVGERLPQPWPDAVAEAARSRLDDLPDALDRAVAGTDLGARHTPAWWRLVGVVQWLLLVAALAGLIWLLAAAGIAAMGLSFEHPRVGSVPAPVVLLVGGLLVGALLALVVRPVASWAARRARARAEARLLAAIAAVGEKLVLAPVRAVLHAYGDVRSALLTAAGR
jgi:GTP-binding protein EngB required for normal cell division